MATPPREVSKNVDDAETPSSEVSPRTGVKFAVVRKKGKLAPMDWLNKNGYRWRSQKKQARSRKTAVLFVLIVAKQSLICPCPFSKSGFFVSRKPR